ncbi:MAG: AAA family ATPase [Candidatus Bipolaricaulota bacterium]|nr:AAA family ATPase [Candidatus Bipolaricaulota bacterium]MDW8030640.1 AAA family ATPase [Candidatus Bipolaricaulota bacterium]
MARKGLKEQKDLLDLLAKIEREPPQSGPALPDRLAHNQLQLETLEIENLWSYKKASLRFEPGITVIAGPNGSGKSSLLESIFFALYGSEARHVIGRSLDEIVRIGADTGSVKLSFFYGGKRYTAQIALRRQGGTVKSERSGCYLTCDDGSLWSGTENVVAEIERLFGMDREGFTNCVYVRQGEIDRLIRADRKDREQMLDGLLGLYKLDLYVNPRSKEALRALNRRIEALTERLARLRHEIDTLERQELLTQKAQLTEQMERIQSELATVDDQRTNAYKLLQSYDEALHQFAQIAQELSQTERELAEKQKRLSQREAERQECEKELERLSARHQRALSSVKASFSKLGLDGARILESLENATTFDDVPQIAERLVAQKAHIESQRAYVGELREQLARLEAEQAQRERTLAQLRHQQRVLEQEKSRAVEQLAQAEHKLTALTKAVLTHLHEVAEGAHALGIPFSTALSDWDPSRIAQIQAMWTEELHRLEEQYEIVKGAVLHGKTHHEALRQELAQKEELLRAGRCPACGQPVPVAELAETLTEIKEKLAELERLIQHEESELQRIEGQIALWKQVRSALDRAALEIERLAARRAELAAHHRMLETLGERIAQTERQIAEETEAVFAQHKERQRLEQALAEANALLLRALEQEEHLERLKREIEDLLRMREQWRVKQGARKTLVESLNELRGDIARLLERRGQLQARLQGQGEIECKRAHVQELLRSLEQQRALLQAQYDDSVHKRGIVQGQIDHLERLRSEFAQLTSDQEELIKLKAELDEIVSVYQMTKVELRKRNLEALNYYFNAFFAVMDSGDSYSRVLVRDDYEIEVELKSGRTISPSLMSGGERALINIALRCAIHQVLAKAVRRMPLILDEPTIYLDRDRIHRLQFLLEDLGKRVGQVIVVSHEVGLVEGADHEYRTEKGSDNISIIYKVR